MPDSAPRALPSRATPAAAVAFFATGAVFAAWPTRLPAVQDELGLSAGALGLAILALEGGAVVGLPAGGALVARLGSRRSLRLGFAVYPTALVAVGLAPSLAALAAALAVMAVANSIVDVAVNAQGVELERRSGRPLLSRLHAGHGFGLVGGGLAGTAAAAAGVPVWTHFTATAACGVMLGRAATRLLVDEPAPAKARGGRVRLTGRFAGLGLLAFCAFLLDGTAAAWSAVHLRADLGASPGLAAGAFTGFALAVAAGRLAGDRLVARHGRVAVLRGSGVVATAGSALAVLAPSATLGLAGWALLGLGVAAVAPTVLGAAGTVTRRPAPAAIAAVTTVGYLGSFSGPPAIGALAELGGLTAALGLLIPVSAAIALLARSASGRG